METKGSLGSWTKVEVKQWWESTSSHVLLAVQQICHASRSWCYWQCDNVVTPLAVGVTGSVTNMSRLTLLVLLAV
jgi:hypothetical protein